jgi:hypothetical protein
MRPRLDYYNKINPPQNRLLSIAGSESKWISFHIPFAEDFRSTSIHAALPRHAKQQQNKRVFFEGGTRGNWGTWKERVGGES